MMRKKKQKYIGSVKFYKNMILLAVIIMILLPTVFAFIYKAKYNHLRKSLDENGGTAAVETTGSETEMSAASEELPQGGKKDPERKPDNEETKETKPRIIYISGQNGETISMVIEDK